MWPSEPGGGQRKLATELDYRDSTGNEMKQFIGLPKDQARSRSLWIECRSSLKAASSVERNRYAFGFFLD